MYYIEWPQTPTILCNLLIGEASVYCVDPSPPTMTLRLNREVLAGMFCASGIEDPEDEVAFN